MALIPGATFGTYRIIEPLGRGGMAAVLKAYEAALDRYVALKVLPAEFMHDSGFAERFEREARVIAKLEHRHIVPIYNFGIEEGTPWMAMRLVPGGTLAALLKQGRLNPARALAVLRESAEALDYAHGRGVLHRDVKPQNILLDHGGRVYLADFGIAKMIEGSALITDSGVITGTPQYMSPEQWRAEKVDHRTDIYALGVVAYEMLAGRVPFSADTPAAMMTKHLMDPIPIPAASEVPESLLRPLLKCLDKNPEARWPSASAFVDSLERGLGRGIEPAAASAGGADATVDLSPPNPTDARSKKSTGLAVVLIALNVVIFGGVALFAPSKRQPEPVEAPQDLTVGGSWNGTYSQNGYTEFGIGQTQLALSQTGSAISGTWSMKPSSKYHYFTKCSRLFQPGSIRSVRGRLSRDGVMV